MPRLDARFEATVTGDRSGDFAGRAVAERQNRPKGDVEMTVESRFEVLLWSDSEQMWARFVVVEDSAQGLVPRSYAVKSTPVTLSELREGVAVGEIWLAEPGSEGQYVFHTRGTLEVTESDSDGAQAAFRLDAKGVADEGDTLRVEVVGRFGVKFLVY